MLEIKEKMSHCFIVSTYSKFYKASEESDKQRKSESSSYHFLEFKCEELNVTYLNFSFLNYIVQC